MYLFINRDRVENPKSHCRFHFSIGGIHERLYTTRRGGHLLDNIIKNNIFAIAIELIDFSATRRPAMDFVKVTKVSVRDSNSASTE